MLWFQTNHTLHIAASPSSWKDAEPTTPELDIVQGKSILIVGKHLEPIFSPELW